jgi:cytochrome c biogenesis protein CcdA/glutaredoxin
MNKAMLFLILLLVIPFVYSQNEPTLVIFHGDGCPHCARALEFLEEMEEKYTSFVVEDYEVYSSQDNRDLLYSVADSYGIEVTGVPTLFINDKTIKGFSDSRKEEIEEEINFCLENDCVHPLEFVGGSGGSTKHLTIPAVLGAAAVDAINPCAFAVLIILLTTILNSGNKKRALYSGIAFALAIYLSYFLMGLGFYSAIQATGITNTFFMAVAVFAIVLGLLNLKDFFWYGKGILMEVPRKWRPKMKKLLKSVTSIPGAFIMGLIVSLFLLPCTSGPYLVILGLLAETTTKAYAIFLLLIYNLIFILPMIIITFLVYFGLTTTGKAEQWRQNKLKILHFIAGIVLILLGLGMILAMKYGFL